MRLGTDAAPLSTQHGRHPPSSGSPVPETSTWSNARPSQTILPPLSPRHTPVILVGAAILSDGRTAASRCILSVVVDAILGPGKKSFRRPDLPLIGPCPID